MTRDSMEELNNVVDIIAKVRGGGELTTTEAKLVVSTIRDTALALRPIFAEFNRKVLEVTELLNSWWDSLPAETRTMLNELVDLPANGAQLTLLPNPSANSDALIDQQVQINMYNARGVENLIEEINRQSYPN